MLIFLLKKCANKQKTPATVLTMFCDTITTAKNKNANRSSTQTAKEIRIDFFQWKNVIAPVANIEIQVEYKF